MALISGMNNAAVQRLRNLWDDVHKEHKDMFRHFELFMSSRDNFKNYRYICAFLVVNSFLLEVLLKWTLM